MAELKGSLKTKHVPEIHLMSLKLVPTSEKLEERLKYSNVALYENEPTVNAT